MSTNRMRGPAGTEGGEILIEAALRLSPPLVGKTVEIGADETTHCCVGGKTQIEMGGDTHGEGDETHSGWGGTPLGLVAIFSAW
jgi:hypothetical protein